MIQLLPQDSDYDFLARIVCAAKDMSAEEEWIEFKGNDEDPERIGQYLAALGNSACLAGKDNGYLIWGIRDATHEIIGTTFNPATAKKGGELLESYLGHMFSKNGHFQFYGLEIDGKKVVVLVIAKATSHPLSFAGTEYVRIGSSLKKLKDYPETERRLWLSLSVFSFETENALPNVTMDRLGEYLDLSAYYLRLRKPYPSELKDIAEDLGRDGLIKKQDDGRFAILNAGALAIGRDLNLFPSIARKGVRVILHDNEYLTSYIDEKVFEQGYALCFEDIASFIDDYGGKKEDISGLNRQSIHPYPIVALRELLGNAFIHQDLTVYGASIIIHLFPSKVAFVNPGSLLCDPKRTVDTQPKSRNERLASILRKMHIVEEQGSGFDRVEERCGEALLPSVAVTTDESSTTVTLYRRKGYKEFTPDDLTRTCYTFACFRHFNGLETNNRALRERLGIEENNAAIASRILKRCVEEGLLYLGPSSVDKRGGNYLPYYTKSI